MGINATSQGRIAEALGLLVRRRATTTDAAEKAAINESIDMLNGQLQDLDAAELLQAAKIVASAADELEKLVGAARIGPFGSYLADMQKVIEGLQGVQGEMHASEALPHADAYPAQPVAQTAQPVPEPAPAAAKPKGTARPPLTSTVYGDLKDEYQALYDKCAVDAKHKDNVAFYTSRLTKFKPTYESVGKDLGIPWHFIGIIHAMECGFNFATHLHNGDPLTARTVKVPAHRPAAGSPPFTWAESARDALMLKGFHHETDWSLPRTLYLFEKYNGFGYRKLGLPSPYLWSFSNNYIKGKFVADHEFNPDAVSRQCGTAVMLKGLQAQEAITIA